MNIVDLIPDSSKMAAMEAAAELIKTPVLIKDALDLAFRNHYPMSMRAANIVEVCSESRPELIEPYLGEIITHIPHFKVDGVKRCLLKLISRYPIKYDEELTSILLQSCFDFLTSSEETVAVKVFSLEILYQITQIEPELKQELISVIEDQIPKNSIAFENRGMKMIKKLLKETQKTN